MKKLWQWLKTKSWRRHLALLVVVIPLIMQKFEVAPAIIDMVNGWMAVLSGGATNDGTIGTLVAGTIFYIYGWIKRKK